MVLINDTFSPLFLIFSCNFSFFNFLLFCLVTKTMEIVINQEYLMPLKLLRFQVNNNSNHFKCHFCSLCVCVVQCIWVKLIIMECNNCKRKATNTSRLMTLVDESQITIYNIINANERKTFVQYNWDQIRKSQIRK